MNKVKLKPSDNRCRTKISRFGDTFEVIDGPKYVSCLSSLGVLLAPLKPNNFVGRELFWVRKDDVCEV